MNLFIINIPPAAHDISLILKIIGNHNVLIGAFYDIDYDIMREITFGIIQAKI